MWRGTRVNIRLLIYHLHPLNVLIFTDMAMTKSSKKFNENLQSGGERQSGGDLQSDGDVPSELYETMEMSQPGSAASPAFDKCPDVRMNIRPGTTQDPICSTRSHLIVTIIHSILFTVMIGLLCFVMIKGNQGTTIWDYSFAPFVINTRDT